jgi:hypothetical protein
MRRTHQLLFTVLLGLQVEAGLASVSLAKLHHTKHKDKERIAQCQREIMASFMKLLSSNEDACTRIEKIRER